MLETWMEQQIIFYAMGIVAGMGILSKLISHITVRKMVRAAGKMNKSNHKLMRLVKAKFEHASMISDKVRNVGVFVKKYIYEYRVFGVRLHTWRQMEKKMVWLEGILGVIGAAAAYEVYGMGDAVYQYGIAGAITTTVLFLVHISSDEKYWLEVTENYMVDFLENVCAHRYARMQQQKELSQETVLQMEEELAELPREEVPVTEPPEEHIPVMEPEKPEERVTQEVRIRRILEEFLA